MAKILTSERAKYMTATVLRLWNDPNGRPRLEQALGPDLARELAERLATPNPWETTRKEAEDDQHSPFLCRMDSRCSTVLEIVRTLENRPEEISYELAVTALMLKTYDEQRQVVAVMREITPSELVLAGIVEFCDTFAMIHTMIHGDERRGVDVIAILSSPAMR